MPVGVIAATVTVFLGSLTGATIKNRLKEDLKENLTILFGICSMTVGIGSVAKASSMTPAILAILLGFVIGDWLQLEKRAIGFFGKVIRRLRLGKDGMDMDFYILAVTLFCCSGFGWYGAMTEGITGEATILLSKAILDFFTALVFAASLGYAMCIIPLPQIVILSAVFGAGRLLSGFLSPTAVLDFTVCGGVLTIATALRITKIKSIPVMNLMPALILVMPISALWTSVISFL